MEKKLSIKIKWKWKLNDLNTIIDSVKFQIKLLSIFKMLKENLYPIKAKRAFANFTI